VLVDGAGTPELSAQWQWAWQKAGVKFRIYSPLSWNALWQRRRWRRLHRKLAVIDESIAFCGGINILDDYWDPAHQVQMSHPRLDFAVRMHGPLARLVQQVMQRQWHQVVLRQDWRHQTVQSNWVSWQQGTWRKQVTQEGVDTRLILRDNLRHRWGIETAYRRALREAQHEVVLACAFFYPAGRLMQALLSAARRGVSVRLIMQGHYEYWLPYRASRHLYGQLLAAGVKIYEYQASYLHAKVAVIDQRWVTVGSSNLDPLSLLLAREANIVTTDPYLAAQLRESLLQALDGACRWIDPAQFAQRGFWQRCVDACASALMRFGVFLTGNRY
jgi:cardiolipin synthase